MPALSYGKRSGPYVRTRYRPPLHRKEGQLIVGRSSRSAIGTLADGRSRYIRLLHLPERHRAESFRRGHVRLDSAGPRTHSADHHVGSGFRDGLTCSYISPNHA